MKKEGLSNQVIDCLKKAQLIDGDKSLSDEEKKLVKALVFSSQWIDDEEFNSCLDSAIIKSHAFLDSSECNKATKDFVLKYFYCLHGSIDPDFKNWDLNDISDITAIVNFAFMHGDQVDGIKDLCYMTSDQKEAFFASVPVENDKVCQYSVGEFFFRVVAKDPIEALGAEIAQGSVENGSDVAKLIASFLEAKISLSGEAAASEADTESEDLEASEGKIASLVVMDEDEEGQETPLKRKRSDRDDDTDGNKMQRAEETDTEMDLDFYESREVTGFADHEVSEVSINLSGLFDDYEG